MCAKLESKMEGNLSIVEVKVSANSAKMMVNEAMIKQV
jgi:hypothetical protein